MQMKILQPLWTFEKAKWRLLDEGEMKILQPLWTFEKAKWRLLDEGRTKAKLERF